MCGWQDVRTLRRNYGMTLTLLSPSTMTAMQVQDSSLCALWGPSQPKASSSGKAMKMHSIILKPICDSLVGNPYRGAEQGGLHNRMGGYRTGTWVTVILKEFLEPGDTLRFECRLAALHTCTQCCVLLARALLLVCFGGSHAVTASVQHCPLSRQHCMQHRSMVGCQVFRDPAN